MLQRNLKMLQEKLGGGGGGNYLNMRRNGYLVFVC